MKVLETRLPGVGTRYRLSFPDWSSFTVLLHNDGKREIYLTDTTDGDSERLFTVPESQARKIAEIFDGTYFEPVPDDIETVFEEARIRWVAIPPDSPVIGTTISDQGVRTRTNAAILAIQRESRTISNPAPETEFKSDDILVIVGTDAAHSAVEELLTQP
jgi:TrkA domain protein